MCLQNARFSPPPVHWCTRHSSVLELWDLLYIFLTRGIYFSRQASERFQELTTVRNTVGAMLPWAEWWIFPAAACIGHALARHTVVHSSSTFMLTLTMEFALAGETSAKRASNVLISHWGLALLDLSLSLRSSCVTKAGGKDQAERPGPSQVSQLGEPSLQPTSQMHEWAQASAAELLDQTRSATNNKSSLF